MSIGQVGVQGKEVGLKVTIDPGGLTPAGKAAKELADQLERVEKNAGKAQKALGFGIGATGSANPMNAMPPGAAAEMAKNKGMFAGMNPTEGLMKEGNFLGGLAAVGAMLETMRGLGDLAKTIANLGMSSRSAREELLELQSKIPIIGGAVSGLTDMALTARTELTHGNTGVHQAGRYLGISLMWPAMIATNAMGYENADWLTGKKATGRLEELKRMERDAGLGLVQTQIDYREHMQRRAIDVTDRERRINLAAKLGYLDSERGLTYARGDVGGGVLGGMGMGGLAGEDAIVQKLQRQIRKGRAELGAVNEIHSEAFVRDAFSQRNLGRTTDKYRAVGQEVLTEMNKLKADPGADDLKLREKMIEYQQRSLELARDMSLAEKDATAYKERSVQLAQKQNEISLAEQEILQRKIAMLADKEASARGDARQWGSMNEEQKWNVQKSLERAKEIGWANLSQEERGILSGAGVTSDFARQESERAGMNDPLLKNLQLQVGKQDAATIAAERVKLQQTFEIKVITDDATLEKAMGKFFDEFRMKMIEFGKREAEMKSMQAKIKEGEAAVVKGAGQ